MRKSTEYIIIHCTASKPSMDVDVATIDRWHRERGFLSCGYNFVLKRDGTKEVARSLMEAGAHAKGYNHKSIGIVMAGGVAEVDVTIPENNFTNEQWATLYNLITDLKEQFPDAKVIGHNEISNKACPSFDVQAWLIDKGLRVVKTITTEDEKLELEEARQKYRGEQLELFDKQRKE